MSGVDKILGGLLGGKGGGVDLTNILAGLGGARSTTGGGGGLNPAMLMALLPLVAGLLKGGGLQKILAGFQAKGFSAQADSWVGTGENQQVSGQQVREVVGEGKVSEIARQAGVSEDEAADGIAQLLPQMVDGASPEGELAPQEDVDGAFAQLQRSAAAAR
jgi:uncharacterized protein YidB (DUF937 family)